MKQDHIVILHGIFRSSKHMRKLASFLETQGYYVHNLDYPSTRNDLETLTDDLITQLKTRLPTDQRVHFIGYSMGGLLVRTILAHYRPAHLGQVVQLAPPNHGSEVANFLRRFWLYKKLYGPAGQQLITDQSAIQPLFGPIDFPLGILAGTRSLDPFSSWCLLPGRNDGKVTVDSTKLSGMTEHHLVPATHTFFPQNRQVHRLTLHFLQHQCFGEVG